MLHICIIDPTRPIIFELLLNLVFAFNHFADGKQSAVLSKKLIHINVEVLDFNLGVMVKLWEILTFSRSGGPK